MNKKISLFILTIFLFFSSNVFSQTWGSILLKSGLKIAGYFVEDEISGQEVLIFYDENDNLLIGEGTDVIEAEDILLVTQENSGPNGATIIFDLVTGGPSSLFANGIIEIIRMELGAYEQLMNYSVVQSYMSSDTDLGTLLTIYGTDYNINCKMTKYYNGYSSAYIGLSNFEVYPEELGSNYAFGKICVDFFLRLDVNGEIYRLPNISLNWNGIYNSILSPNLNYIVEIPSGIADEIWQNDLDVVLVVSDKNMFGKIKKVFPATMGDPLSINLPPTPTGLDGTYQNGTTTLTWEAASFAQFDHYNVYRSTQYNFLANQSTLIGSSINKEYIDTQVELGEQYYYKIITVAQDGTLGNVSQALQISPSIQLLSTVELISSEIIYQNDLVEVGGILSNTESDLITSAKIKAEIEEINFLAFEDTTDINGSYTGTFYAPHPPGNYTLKVYATKGNMSVTEYLYFTVRPTLNKDHDIEIVQSEINEKIIEPNGNLNNLISMSNNGEYDENYITVHYELNDNASNVYLSSSESETLSIGEVKNKTKSILAPALTEGYYNFKVRLNASFDEYEGNNLKVHSFYSKVLPEQKNYKMDQHAIEIGESTDVSGNNIVLNSLNGSEFNFSINGNSETIDINKFWLSADEQLLLSPTNNIGDTIAQFRCGGLTTTCDITPSEDFIYAGDTSFYHLTYPSGTDIMEDFELFNYNFTSTIPEAEYFVNLCAEANEKDLRIITAGGTNTEYGFYFKTIDTDDFWWISKVILKTMPKHNVAISGLNVENNYLENGGVNIPGDNFTISATIDNNTLYREKIACQLKITKEDSLIYTNTQHIDIEPYGSTNYEGFWTTTGLEEETYDIALKMYANDDNIGNETLASSVFIDATPNLELNFVNDSTTFNINDTIDMIAEVSYNSTVIDDATVSGTVITPGGTEIDVSLNWDGMLNAYTTKVYAEIGGIYKLNVKANKLRFIDCEKNTIYKTLVDLSFDCPDNNIIPGDYSAIDIYSTPVGNLNGIAFDLNYDPSKIKIVDIIETGFLSENDNVNTTANFMSENGETIAGITRLTNNQRGCTSFYTKKIARVLFKALDNGTCEVITLNQSLVSADGNEIPTTANNTSLNINENTISIVLQSQDSVSLNDTCEASVLLTNLNNVSTFYGEINFDIDKIRLKNLLETNFFNEFYTVNTNFIYNIDNNSGKAIFGINRINDEYGITNEIGNALKIEYITVDTGKFDFSINNIQLIDPEAEIEFAYDVLENDSIVIIPSGNSEETTLYFSPDTVYVPYETTEQLDVKVNSISNLHSFACDLNYDPSKIRINNLVEGDFLNEGSSGTTAFNYTIDSVSGKVILGISRLNQSGVTSLNDTTLLTLDIERIGGGDTDVYMSNVGLIAPDGITNYPYTLNNAIIKENISISFNILDNISNPIQNASVSLEGYGTKLSGTDGIAIFDSIYPSPLIPFSISANGYYPIEDTVFNVNKNISKDITMEVKTYEATFIINDGSNPISGATVSLTGYGIKTTDALGTVVFSNIESEAGINYAITADGYIDSTGTIDVLNSDITKTISLQFITYEATFFIDDGSIPIEGATVSLNGYGDLLTDALGQAVFTDVVPEYGISFSINANGYYEEIGVIDVINQNITETVSLSLIPTYQVTFIVDDGTNPIEGATVSLTGYGDLTTNASGQAIFTSVIPENGIAYTVNATGYDELTGTVDVIDQNITENISLTLTTYDVTFIVDDGTNPIEGATVNLTGYGDLTTDASGQAIFTSVIPENGIAYTVNASGYDEHSGTVDIVDQNITENVFLTLTTYDVAFIVDDGTNPIEGATVNLTGYGDLTTDASGQAIFTSVIPENGIAYTVNASGYDEHSGTVDVVDQNITENVSLTLTTYDVAFTVNDGTNPLEGATVNLTGYGDLTTNASGQAIFTSVIPENGIAYTVNATGYDELTGTVDVIDQNITENISLTLTTYDVTFTVNDGTNPLEGATVNLTGYGDLTTDASGQAVFTSVIPENGIAYTVNATGYDELTGTIDVIDQNITEIISLTLTTYEVTFIVDDGTDPIDGATVSLTGYGNLTTDASGQATFTSVIPENGIAYIVNATGYDGLTGTVDVINQNITENVSLSLTTYEVTFTVDDGIDPIEGATISLSGYGDLTTDASGQAIFASVIPENGIAYTVNATGYDELTGTVNVINQNITENVSLTLTTYEVTFTVDDGIDPIEGATISLSGYGDLTTDASGQAMFTSIIPENNIAYIVDASGYDELTGTVDVIDQNIIETISLTLITYDVSFIVDDGTNPIEDANVSLSGYGTETTNSLGEAMFMEVSPGNNIPYSVTAENFYEYEGYCSVIDANINLTVSLIPDHVKNIESKDFKIYPNPTDNNIAIYFNGNKGMIDYSIKGLTGKVIKDGKINTGELKKYEISLGKYGKGVYFLHLNGIDHHSVTKIVVN